MRVPQIVSDFFEWRWAPCVGLTAGSLAFVALSLLLIPTRLGGEPRVSTSVSSFESSRPQRALYAAALAREVTDPGEQRLEEARVERSAPPPSPRSTEPTAPPARGFSPPIARPEPLVPEPAPAPAPPAAPPPDAPAPAPGSVVVIQPVPGGESREVTAQ